MGPSSVLFPTLFRRASNRMSLVSECYEGEEGNSVSGNVLLRRVLCHSEETKFGSFLSILSNVFLYREIVDVCIWKPSPSRVFSTKSYCSAFVELCSARSHCLLVRLGLAPLHWRPLLVGG